MYQVLVRITNSSSLNLLLLSSFLIGITVCRAQGINVSGIIVSDSTEVNTYYIDVVYGNNPANTHKMDCPSFQLKIEKNAFPCNLHIRKEGFRILEIALTETENDSIDLGMLRLEPLTQTLDEVVVTSKQPTVSYNKGVMSVKIDGTSLESMGKLMEMLEYVPGMIRKGNGVEVLGRGAPIYLLNGVEIRNTHFLSTLDAGQISKIEIIKHPSSEYPSGTKAVVNIVTKKTLKDNISVSVGSATVFRRKTSEFPIAFVSYKKGNWLMNLSYEYTYWKNLNKETYYRDIYSLARTFHAEWQREDYSLDKGHKLSYSVEFTPSDKHKFGLMYLFSHDDENEPITGQNVESSTNKAIVVKDVIENKKKKDNKHLMNIYWNGKLNEKSSLQFIQDISLVSKDGIEDVTETSLKTKSELHNITDSKYRSDVYTSNLKYKNEDLASLDCSFGLRYDYFKTEMETVSNDIAKALERSYCNSVSTENIYSAYGELSREWDKFDISAGIRYEYLKRSISNASEIGAKPVFVDDSNKGFFPHLSMEYRPNDDWSLSFNYDTDISYPQLAMLNSGVIYKDSLTYETGDINIKPSQTHSLSFDVNWNAFSISASYDYTKNEIITAYTQIDSESDVVCSNPVNLKSVSEFGITFGFNKNWNKLNANVNVYEGFPNSRITYLGNEIKVNKAFSNGNARLAYNMSSKLSIYTQFMYQSYRESDVSVQMCLNKWDIGITGNLGKLKYRLSFEDILHRAHFNNCYDRYLNVKDGTLGTNDMRGVTLSLTYKLFSKEAKTENEVSNTNILNRL